MGIFSFISVPLGYLMSFIYGFVQNYGVSLLIFTLITRLILLPLYIKQQKSMVQMNILKPKMDALQKQYGDNKEKLGEETMKLYKKHGVSPFSGCLPLLIQFPLLIALYDVIRKPLTYIWYMSQDTINALSAQFVSGKVAYPEIEISRNLVGQYGYTNFNFLGLDLGLTPTFNLNAPMFGIDWIWIIPILAALTTYLSSKFMNIGIVKTEEEKEAEANKRPPKPGETDPNQTANSMTKFMPFLTLWFTFIMPAGISIYWIAGNILQIIQQFAINRYYVPKMKERMLLENEEPKNYRKKRKK
ncbi:MAG: YidC/Oxa1 family membrane protein insertase [Clostridia bacterium]|nr:YidC/Oxa1 family membrane protein insertase [Clostridia bacterium]